MSPFPPLQGLCWCPWLILVFISGFVLLGGSFEALALLQEPTGGLSGQGRVAGQCQGVCEPWGALQEPLQGTGHFVVAQAVLDRPS